MTNNNGAKIAIAVAVIGALGVIGSAIINNSRNLFSDQDNPQVKIDEIHDPEIRNVIQRAIDLGTKAYWNLDSSSLNKVFDGEALKLLEENISSFRNKGHRPKTIGENFEIIGDINYLKDQDDILRAKVKFKRNIQTFIYSINDDENCLLQTPPYDLILTYSLKNSVKQWKITSIILDSERMNTDLPCL